ncbi:hypothetical protein CHRY9390_01680 [Chryseobacterium aquaeductus]|uniref:Uncharacterized protein n=1 Tax=Chryseobacterium aquaeductus TaxID=2675056 RepID=A0A9N8QQL3_9FLAO|nr:hypothetical protein [Chryseobacterium aquaeductus]CAA7331001.1 hypothetical protein CHRY9390_01680 [Chryseobacterium potabilaquae]CAD7807582.1 hypothetical protein CHRY9390_01680 [Chryseobacterium aquaeductus]
MAYTVISVFPATVDTEEIKRELQDQGFNGSDIIISTSKYEGESAIGDYSDDEKTKSFWDHVFVSDNEMLDAYSRESAGKTNVVVYTSNIDDAQKAKNVLYSKGAVEVKKKTSEDQQPESGAEAAGLPQDVYDGIIAKAKHDVYFLDNERVYSPTTKGMGDTMDGLGSKD